MAAGPSSFRYITPSDALYVRNHAPVPVGGDGVTDEISFELATVESSIATAAAETPGKKASADSDTADTANTETVTALSLKDLEEQVRRGGGEAATLTLPIYI